MKMSGNTIFITGGSAGLGLAYAETFLEKKNKVIICGRNETELAQVKQAHPDIHIIKCDVTKANEVEGMLREVQKKFSDVNILINNAGIQYNYTFHDDPDALRKIDEEIDVNFRAVVKLTRLFLPLLMKQNAAAVVNISSPLAIVPKESAPLYCATKAAVQIFSRVLRYQLEKTPVNVFTILPPLVDTAMTKGRGEKLKISPEVTAVELIRGMEHDHYELPIKKAKLLLFVYRWMPGLAYKIMRKGL